MADPTILFIKPKAISPRDKKTLSAAGVIVIETDDPQAMKFTRAFAEVSATEMLIAACGAIHKNSYDGVRVEFAEAICALIEAKKQ